MLYLREVWLLDSQTTHNLCCNPRMVKKIKKAQKTLNMSDNRGVMKITQEAKVPGLYPEGMKPAQTWFNKRCITNLLSFKELIKFFCVTYDSEEATALTVQWSVYGLVDLHFVMHPSRLHVLETNKMGHCFVQMVENNMKLFMK